MSQIPPPPPGQPAPTIGTSGVGSNKNLYTILAWGLLPPVGSLIFLFIGKDDPDVKYNAAQAFIIHAPFLLVSIVLSFSPIYFLWFCLWFAVWLVGLFLAVQANGARVNYPVLGPIAAQYAPVVENWAK